MNIDKILKKYNDASTERDQFRSMMSEVYRYAIPSRNTWDNVSAGARNDIVIYNSYPTISTMSFANNMLNLIAPSGLKFFSLASKERLDDDKQEQFNKQVAPISDLIFDYIDRSNFYIAAHEAMIDLAAGTGGILCKFSGDLSNPLSFTSLDMSTLCFTEGADGLISNVFREVSDMDISLAKSLFPLAKFPTHQERLNFLVASVKDEEANNFNYMIINKETKEIYFEKTYKTNPFIVFRWSKLAGESRGRGVLTNMLATIKTANLMMSDILTASQRAIAPAIVAYENSIVNPANTDFGPNSIITLKPLQGINQPITTLPFSGNLPFGIEMVQEFNRQIDESFLNNVLGNVGSSQQTATEITARLQLASNQLGSHYGRLQREFLAPVINHAIEILTTVGLISRDVLGDFKLTYQSPITNIQKQQDYQKFMQYAQTLAQLGGNNAQQVLFASLDVAKLPTWVAENLGVDMSIVKTSSDIKEMMQQMIQLQQQQQRIQQMQQANPALGSQAISTGQPGIKY